MNMEEENVNVVVRIRPMQAHEKKNGDVPCVKGEKSGKEVQVKVGPLDAQVYRCHRCFNAETSQSDFFVECGITDLLDSSMDGYRACAFAFGQTGAGKTFTMVGATKGISHKDKQVGLIARSLEYLYTKLHSGGHKFRIRISCLEIYHEHVYDLFAEEKERLPLAVREHATEGFFLEGSRLVECKDYEVACAALDVAVKNRQVGGHDLNSRSSRSHCMTEIYIDTGSRESSDLSMTDDRSVDHYLNRGKMTLVDLAGSERLKNTNSTGKVLQEAGFINRSLYVLGKVIAGLVRTNGDLNHKDVPYRDSKLTKLLISSLGGNSRTVLIACVSEAKGSQAETLRTLKFSMSCARIRNKPVKFLDPQEKLILDLKDEIKRLRHENKRLRSTIVTAPSSSDSIGDHFTPLDETDSPMKRATSAGGFDDRARQYGYRKSKQNLVSIKKKKQTPKPKKKHPEIFYKYPQLQSILKDEIKKGKNVRDSNDKLSVQSHSSNQSRVKGGPHSQGPSAALLLEPDSDYGNDDIRSVGSASKHKLRSAEILDEVIHRKAGGPMIFKDKESPIPSLRDSRLNQYYPAENYVKAMDAAKEEVLDPPKEDQLDAEHANIPVDGLQFIKKKSKPKKVPQWKAEKKPSPYLIPLLKEDKQPVKKEKSKESLPQIKQPSKVVSKAKGNTEPSDLEQNQRDELVRLDTVDSNEKKLQKKLVKKVDQPSGRRLVAAQPIEHHSSLPILPSISPRENQVHNPSRNPHDTKLPKVKLSDIPSDNELRNVLRASMTEPILPTNSKPESTSREPAGIIEEPVEEEQLLPSRSQKNSPTRTDVKEQTPKSSMKIAIEEDDDDYGYEFDEDEEENVDAGKDVSTPERLTKKLEKLEKSLVIKRMEMEDSPGHVTSEVEEKFMHLELEAKAIRVELAAITGDISPTKLIKHDDVQHEYGEEDFTMEEEEDELPFQKLASPENSKSNSKSEDASPSKPSESAKLQSPSTDATGQKMWFLREGQKQSSTSSDLNSSMGGNDLERDPSAKRFIDVLGKSYAEELHLITQNISSPSKYSASPAAEPLKTQNTETVSPSKLDHFQSVPDDEAKNDYGDDDFDGFEDLVDDIPSNPAKTLPPLVQPSPVKESISDDGPTEALSCVPSTNEHAPIVVVEASPPLNISETIQPVEDHDDYGEEEFDAYEDEFEIGEDD